jgi:hypothetical protein
MFTRYRSLTYEAINNVRLLASRSALQTYTVVPTHHQTKRQLLFKAHFVVGERAVGENDLKHVSHSPLGRIAQ